VKIAIHHQNKRRHDPDLDQIGQDLMRHAGMARPTEKPNGPHRKAQALHKAKTPLRAAPINELSATDTANALRFRPMAARVFPQFAAENRRGLGFVRRR
jgi:hypothetical protein